MKLGLQRKQGPGMLARTNIIFKGKFFLQFKSVCGTLFA